MRTAPHPDNIAELRSTYGTNSWEVRHALWRDRGNSCGECERIERSVDSPVPAAAGRALGLVDRASRWLGFQPPLLRDGSRVEGRSNVSWSVSPDELVEPADPRSLDQLRRAAELLTLKIAGNNVRGPMQNRVQWQAMQDALQDQADAAWKDYYKRLEEKNF